MKFMVHNHLGSNRERGEIKTLKDLNFSIWMGKLTWVQFKTGFIFEAIFEEIITYVHLL